MAPEPGPAASIDEVAFSKAHASPSVRKFARELGADLGKIKGTGVKGRITQDDVKSARQGIAERCRRCPRGRSAGLPRVATVDFAKFGPVEIKPLSRIQKISGSRLQASWLNLPHVTQHEDADITDLEAARGALKNNAAQEGVRLTPLVFIIRACIVALKEFPRFNASLDAAGDNLVFKKYFNIGFAAEHLTAWSCRSFPNADRLSIYYTARACGGLCRGKLGRASLKPPRCRVGPSQSRAWEASAERNFTPIINAPEVAILGVSRSSQKPVYERGGFGSPPYAAPVSFV